MKKFLLLMSVVLLLFSLTACGGENVENADIKPSESVVQVESGDDAINSENQVVSNETENVEWKQFLKEYNEWVDDYIVLLKKYNANPTDATILSDYTEMMNDLTEWSARADKITKELESSPEAVAEYAAELAKIAEKLEAATK